MCPQRGLIPTASAEEGNPTTLQTSVCHEAFASHQSSIEGFRLHWLLQPWTPPPRPTLWEPQTAACPPAHPRLVSATLVQEQPRRARKVTGPLRWQAGDGILPAGRGGRSPAAPAHCRVHHGQGGGGTREEAGLREGARQARSLPARILFHLLMGEMCP